MVSQNAAVMLKSFFGNTTMGAVRINKNSKVAGHESFTELRGTAESSDDFLYGSVTMSVPFNSIYKTLIRAALNFDNF